MKTVIIVQARMTSTRLPGKVLKEVQGKPLLAYQIERLQRVKYAGELVIATTYNQTDESIVKLCKELGVSYFRGSEEDVLSRYYETVKTYKAGVIVRITSDCPIIDPQVVDNVIKFYLDNHTKYDYVSNTLKRTYPRGMDTEVFSFKVLEQAHLEAENQPDREHVTPFIYRHPQRYRLGNVSYVKNVSHYRWTVDTIEDFILIEKIISSLYPKNPLFKLEDCIQLLLENPEWQEINAKVNQKVYGE